MYRKSKWTAYLEPVMLVFLLLFGKDISAAQLAEKTGLPLDALTVGMGLYTLHFLLRRFSRGTRNLFCGDSRLFLFFMGLLGFWFIYGCVGAFVSPYTNPVSGLKQMYYLLLNGCTAFCVYEYCSSVERTERLVRVLGWGCSIMIVFCLAESFVGFHMKGSFYQNPGLWFNGKATVPSGLYAPTLFLSSGFDYICNDVSARICILLPALFVTGGEKLWGKALRILLVLLALYTMILNDANVVIVALIVALVVYGALVRSVRITTGGMAIGSLALGCGGSAYLTKGLLAVKERFWTGKHTLPWSRFTYSGSLSGVKSLVDTGSAQVNKGSLDIRADICLDSLDMALGTRLLGVGPQGYYQWFAEHPPRTMYLLPHCWYLEVLSQYGIVVFLGYMGSLITMYIKMILAYRKNHRSVYAVVIAMCTAFVFACVAPSTYIGYAYPWCLPGLCLALLRPNCKEE